MTIKGVYQITNVRNGRRYIGSAVNVRKRCYHHWKRMTKGLHGNRFLQRTWDKYGEQVFQYEVLEAVKDKNKLTEREQWYLDNHKPEYNMCPTAGNWLGHKHTEEAKKKNSILSRQMWSDPQKREAMSERYRGEGNPKAKLTEKDVVHIRHVLATTNLTHAEIGKMFNVSKGTISNINGGFTWKHVKAGDL